MLNNILNEAQATKMIALLITLTVSRAIRLQLDGNLSLDGFNQEWALVSGGLILGQLVNLFVTTKLMEKIKALTVGGVDVYQSTRENLIEDMIELIVMLLTQQLFVDLMKGRSIVLSPETLRTLFLAICGLLLYGIVFEPIIDNYTFSETDSTDNTIKEVVSNVFKKVLSLATADYMSDLAFDNFPHEAAITAVGVGLGEAADSHLINASGIYDTGNVSGTNTDKMSRGTT